MPILFAPLLGFLLGLALAWIARDELARDERDSQGRRPLVLSPPVAVSAALGLLIYAPMAGYFAAFHGDWSYLYLYPHHSIPSAVDLALVLVSGALVPLGTLVAAPAARAKKLAAVAWLGVVPAVLAAALFAFSARRLSISATYAQFHGGFGTVPIGASTLGRGVLFMIIVGALAVAWTVRCLASSVPERHGRSGRT